MTTALHTAPSASVSPARIGSIIAAIAVVLAAAFAILALTNDASDSPLTQSPLAGSAAGPNADLAPAWAASFSGIPAAGPSADLAPAAQR